MRRSLIQTVRNQASILPQRRTKQAQSVKTPCAPTVLTSRPHRTSFRSQQYICARCLSTARASLQTSAQPNTAPENPIHPPQKPRSAYSLFPETLPSGPPPQGPFKIDTTSLRREFLKLQAAAHPDRHTDPVNKARAEATSAALNDSYRTLLDPLLRARHILLTEAGLDLEGDEAAKEQDSELLMTVLEAREVIEEAQEEGDLASLREENEMRIAQSEKELVGCFDRGDWEAAKEECVRLRYWANIRQSLREWEPGKPVVLVH